MKHIVFLLSVFILLVSLSGDPGAAEIKINVQVAPPPPKPAHLTIAVSFDDPSGNRALDAEETALLQVEVTNKGPGQAHRVIIKTQTISGVKAVALPKPASIGDMPAGSKAIKRLVVSGGRDLETGNLRMKVLALELNGFDADPVNITLSTRKFEPAALEVVDMGIDDQSQNGQVEPVEVVTVTARIRNTGLGEARYVSARVKLGRNVYRALESKLAFDLGNMQPDEWQDVRFSFYTNKRIQAGQFIPIHLTISDQRSGKTVRAPLKLVMNVPQRTHKEVVIAERQQGQKKEVDVASLSVDVDRNIPKGRTAGPFDVAVIVGNQNYQRPGVPKVKFAFRDLGVVREYLLKTFGFLPRNIIEERDATKGVFEMLFGTREKQESKLFDWVKHGKSRVFIYYVGHGAPDLDTGDGYFVPVDADPDYIASTGYSRSLFFANIKRIPAKEMVVVLDACFSGRTPEGILFKNISPQLLRIRETAVDIKQGAVLSSSRGDQVSCWYPDKRHSMFTYFFLKGLQGEADANHDSKITVGEMEAWLTEWVPYWARRVGGKSQNPKVEGQKHLVLVRFE